MWNKCEDLHEASKEGLIMEKNHTEDDELFDLRTIMHKNIIFVRFWLKVFVEVSGNDVIMLIN